MDSGLNIEMNYKQFKEYPGSVNHLEAAKEENKQLVANLREVSFTSNLSYLDDPQRVHEL